MVGKRKSSSSKEEILERTARVLDAWQSYPDFAHFLNALLDANGLTTRSFAEQYTEATGRSIDMSMLRVGRLRPSYQFIEDVADHGLLSLSDASRSGSDQRAALFAVAGLIEVTPESTRQWNHDVLADWQRRREQRPSSSQPTWGELMHKLLDFQTQGWRWRYDEIAAAANTTKTGCMLNVGRASDLILGRSIPTQAERTALAHVAGLTPAQCAAIESAVEDKTLPLRRKPMRSAFSTLFTEILAKIAAYGITQQQLAQRAVSYCGNEPVLSTATISMWKNGKNKPTLASLRSLICTLEECQDQLCRPIVSPEEIQQLMSAAGFSADDLTATTHDIIARIDETTRLKPLLSALRNAADLSVPPSAVDRAEAQPDRTIGSHRLVSRVNKWESSCAPEIPKPEQLRGLLERYNRLLQANGQAQLSDAEIQKVVQVSQREHPSSLSVEGQRVTLKHMPLASRRPITPDLDDSRSR